MKESFLQGLESFYQGMESTPDSLKLIRKKAWEHFLELGLPEKEDSFQYVPLDKLYGKEWQNNRLQPLITKDEIEKHILPECQMSHIVLVNGVARLDLSDIRSLPKSLVILPLKDAMGSYSAFLQARFSKMLKEERDPFVVLNAALLQGLFILVPTKTVLGVPIQIVELFEENLTTAYQRHIQLFIGANADVSIVLSSAELRSSASTCFSNQVMDGVLEEGAKLTLNVMSNAKEQIVLDAVRITQKKESKLFITHMEEGSPLSRRDYRLTLAGEFSEANLKSLAYLQKNRQSHTHVLLEHLAPNTTSNQLVKNVLFDVSKSSFEGKIFVAKEAQKTLAYQLNNNLLLGEYTQANSKPNLQIFADDVKASHGATAACLDEDQLFYLKTRGLTEENAKRLLVVGFCKEIVQSFTLDSLHIETLQTIDEMADVSL